MPFRRFWIDLDSETGRQKAGTIMQTNLAGRSGRSGLESVRSDDPVRRFRRRIDIRLENIRKRKTRFGEILPRTSGRRELRCLA